MNDVVLHCGDALEYMRGMEAGSVDCVVTSPPYNMGGFMRDGRRREYSSYSDDLPDAEYRQFIGDVIRECARIVKVGGAIYWNHRGTVKGWHYVAPHWVVELCPIQLMQEIIWKFPASAEVATVKWYPRKEYIYFFTKGRPAYFNEAMARFTDVWEFNHCNNATSHPAPFPVELPRRAILGSTRPGDLVFDPFLGSGTTAVAAVMEGRRAIGVEIDPGYFAIAQRRIADAQARPPLIPHADLTPPSQAEMFTP